MFPSQKKKKKKHIYKEPFLVLPICRNPSGSHALPSFLVCFRRFLLVRDKGYRVRAYMRVYLGGKYCLVAKRKAEVA